MFNALLQEMYAWCLRTENNILLEMPVPTSFSLRRERLIKPSKLVNRNKQFHNNGGAVLNRYKSLRPAIIFVV